MEESVSGWLSRALLWKNRVILLTILTANDFRLHLETLLDVRWRDPTYTPFLWTFNQGSDVYNTFWSLYWGLGFVTALSLIFWRERKDTNTSGQSTK